MAEVTWDRFQKLWPYQYLQDQHVTIIGPTGSGKTVLAQRLVERRGHVVALGVKPKDSSMTPLLQQGWHRVETWNQRPRTARRILLWPKPTSVGEDRHHHKQVFSDLLESVYKQGSWCIWTDELRYLTHNCRMLELFQQMYVTSRSNNISLVSSAQRPAFVPLEAYSQATHLFLYRTGDERDLARMGGLNGTSAKQVAATVADLPKHTFLHLNTQTGEQTISKVQL